MRDILFYYCFSWKYVAVVQSMLQSIFMLIPHTFQSTQNHTNLHLSIMSSSTKESSNNEDFTKDAKAWEARVQKVRQWYQNKGYRVHSGFQFGCELVLYADDPSKVHSDFCVHVVPEGEKELMLVAK